VPPGKFWEGDALVDCPRGMYREGFVRLHNVDAIPCKACPEGWTTEKTGSPAKRLCNSELRCLLLARQAPRLQLDGTCLDLAPCASHVKQYTYHMI
jgi:hypothetical protein